MTTSSKSKKAKAPFVTVPEDWVDAQGDVETVGTVPYEPRWVEIGLGVTIPVGDYGNVKPRVSMRIDQDGDRDSQINAALETAVQAFAAIDGHFDVIVSELISGQSGKPGYRERVDKLEEKVKDTRDALRRAAERIKELESRNNTFGIFPPAISTGTNTAFPPNIVRPMYETMTIPPEAT